MAVDTQETRDPEVLEAKIVKLRGEVVQLRTMITQLTEQEARRTAREAERLGELEELRRLVTKDHLTGVLNLRGFEEALSHHLAGVRRDLRGGRSPDQSTLVYIDLDRFKPINDMLGHDVGNRALMKFANTMREILRPTDIIGRLGGDEFAVLLHDVGSQELAQKVVTKLTQAVSQLTLRGVDDVALSALLEAVGRRHILAFSAGFHVITDADHSKEQVIALAEADVPKFQHQRYLYASA
jgi:diguanylate cyclase (GGDEF)-like protein